MRSRSILSILLCLCLILIIAPAIASTITAENVGSYSITATPGHVFYKIKISDLPIGTNQTHTLMYQGSPYLLTINTWASEYYLGPVNVGGLWKNADISLTMPNGSVQTSHTSATTVVGSYSTIIQPTMRSDSSVLESGTAMFFTVDLNIGLVPASAQFSTAPMGYKPETSIPFTAASGQFSNAQRTSVYVYQVTIKEFVETIQTYNPAAGIGDLGSAIFQWTWNAVMGFLNMIPVIGPLMVSFIEISGAPLTGLFFWLRWVVDNFPAIILSIECIILMFAVINAGKGKRAFGKMANNIFRYNVMFITGIFTLFIWVRDWLYIIIDIVAKIVQGMKPL